MFAIEGPEPADASFSTVELNVKDTPETLVSENQLIINCMNYVYSFKHDRTNYIFTAFLSWIFSWEHAILMAALGVAGGAFISSSRITGFRLETNN